MGSAHRASDCKAYSMACFRPIYAITLLLFILVEVISDEHSLPGSSHPKEIEGLSLSPRDSSGYRWCSPRCDVSRHPQCCYNPVCRRKRARGRGCSWHPYLEAPPDLTLGSCSDSQSPLGNTNVPKQGEVSQS